jgi:hypothetical protein
VLSESATKPPHLRELGCAGLNCFAKSVITTVDGMVIANNQRSSERLMRGASMIETLLFFAIVSPVVVATVDLMFLI